MLNLIKSFRIFQEKSGVISPHPVWCCVYDGCYLHTCDSLPKLLWEVLTEFRHEKHLVGYW